MNLSLRQSWKQRTVGCKDWLCPVVLARSGHTLRLNSNPPASHWWLHTMSHLWHLKTPTDQAQGWTLHWEGLVTSNRYGFANILGWIVHLVQPWKTRHLTTEVLSEIAFTHKVGPPHHVLGICSQQPQIDSLSSPWSLPPNQNKLKLRTHNSSRVKQPPSRETGVSTSPRGEESLTNAVTPGLSWFILRLLSTFLAPGWGLRAQAPGSQSLG